MINIIDPHVIVGNNKKTSKVGSEDTARNSMIKIPLIQSSPKL